LIGFRDRLNYLSCWAVAARPRLWHDWSGGSIRLGRIRLLKEDINEN
jgi:hypothetical protein